MLMAMTAQRIGLLVIMIAALARPTLAQRVDSTRGHAGIFEKMYHGAVESIAWYDVPLAAADLAELALVPPNTPGKPVKFPPTALDRNIEPHIGVHGSQTIIGRMGETGFAGLFGIRILVNIGSDLAGANITSEDYHRTFWFYKSLVYTLSLTEFAKVLVERERPDRSDNQSFFSGHSSLSFCAASYLSLELGDWYDQWETTARDESLRTALKIGSDVVLYGGATYVAYSRLHDEKHYFSDVVVGAAVGTVIGNLMYRWHRSTILSEHADLSFFIVNRVPTVTVALGF
jgi:membrane-associated phospholipid phosphatase